MFILIEFRHYAQITRSETIKSFAAILWPILSCLIFLLSRSPFSTHLVVFIVLSFVFKLSFVISSLRLISVQTALCALAEIVSMRFVNGVGPRPGVMGIDYPTACWLYKYANSMANVESCISITL